MSYDLEFELVRGVKSGGAGDAVGFHRDIGESAGSDDVARSVFHVHRDGYVLRGL